MSILIVLAEEAHELAPLVMPLWAFPLIAAVFFAITLLITWSYRDVANRWRDDRARQASPTPDEYGHSTSHGHPPD